MNNDDKLIANRLLDYANQCYQRNIPVVTDFLDLYKQSIFHSILHKMPPICWKAIGGYDLAERKVILFKPYEEFPDPEIFSTIKIQASNNKYREQLTHRDYLGSILNLGITREKIGDIIIKSDATYLFCSLNITDFLLDNILKIKNTFVRTELVYLDHLEFTPNYKEIKGSVASLRLDSVIALGFSGSRSHLISYIETGKVSVNGQIITSNGYSLKVNDLISVRGLGKIKFINTICETKKNRQMVIIYKFI